MQASWLSYNVGRSIKGGKAQAADMKVAVLMGGQSGEHEVSLISGNSILEALQSQGFETIKVVISLDGVWTLEDGREVTILPKPSKGLWLMEENRGIPVDLVFPVLHGPKGEDGTIQGLLELASIPYVGSGVLGSACGMDKAVMKALFRDAGLPTPKTILLEEIDEVYAETEIGYPCFVKPANLGSSVGITKAKDRGQLRTALEVAFQYDTRVVVEEAVKNPREIECSVLGNERLFVSIPGEIVPDDEFYTYDAKYHSEGSKLLIPAELSEDQVQTVQELAIKAFRAVGASGLARVDFLVEGDTGKVLLNEINTMPGFTAISMYPKLWEKTPEGYTYGKLVSELAALALERYKKRKALKITR